MATNFPVRIISVNDDDYPRLLKEIHDPPQQLFVRGQMDPDALYFAVVGTRKLSAYGKQATSPIVRELVRAGLVIVSGLAYGIDTEAHKAATEAGGKTIAVLGSGIDDKSIYPAVNKNLARKILETGGALISEYPEGTGPEPWHFPARNRIIAGMSKGVLVVEAPKGSGALITADIALRENREVFAVPGPITLENSFGPNRLIQMGAKLVLSAGDILEEWGLHPRTLSPELVEGQALQFTNEEKKIFEAVKEAPQHIDAIVEKTGYDIIKLTTLLTTMELDGKIKNLGGGLYGVA